MKAVKFGCALLIIGIITFIVGIYLAVSRGIIFLPFIAFACVACGIICILVGAVSASAKELQESQMKRAEQDEDSATNSSSVDQAFNKLGSEISSAANAGVRKLKRWLNTDAPEVPTKCPNCNANLDQKDSYVKCPYCGFKKNLY